MLRIAAAIVVSSLLVGRASTEVRENAKQGGWFESTLFAKYRMPARFVSLRGVVCADDELDTGYVICRVGFQGWTCGNFVRQQALGFRR